jgi:phosphoglycolate phosphatase-like HAD superfamily hydrolase
MAKLLLFDIDGTLVDTGGAGVRAFARVLAESFGASDAMAGIPLAGRTDRAILADALGRAAPDHQPDDGWLQAFAERYVTLLAEEMQVPSPRRRLLPGVVGALEAAGAVPEVHIALLTGNFRKGAEVKLAHFDIWHRFAFGAYGDDAIDRNDLFPVAIERARAHGVPALGPRDVLVIGDTPHDVACARSGGAVAVGVTTGPYDRAALEAAGADIVLEDLTRFGEIGTLLA